MNEVKMRSEILFLYDCKDINPNGDPMDENKPRIDEETEINIVTDVRLKRTIRDYLHNFKGLPIWVLEEVIEDGSRKTREQKLQDIDIKNKQDAEEKLLKKFIDLRLFGATIAAKFKKRKKTQGSEEETTKKGENVFTWIGPVQFRFGRSLHKVDIQLIKGTSVLPTQERKSAGAFTEMYTLPYSLICFYGIINENAAKTTKLTEEDINELLDGIWNGTKNLITRTKIGQMPRFLLRVIYKENNFHIGDLDKKIKLEKEKDDKEIRDIKEVKINIDELLSILKTNSDKIELLELEVNNDVIFIFNGKEIKREEIREIFNNIGVKVKKLDIDK